MSKKQWLVLLMLFLTYLLFGASIFFYIESGLERDKVLEAKKDRKEIYELLHRHYVPSANHSHHEILRKLTEYCGKPVYNVSDDEEDHYKWDFYNSFYFAYTVVSTIGYGNLFPTSTLSRILMIFYALIGIPMNGILLTQLGEFFSHVFIKAHKKYKSYKHSQPSSDCCAKKPTPFEKRKVELGAQILIYLLLGFIVFIFFPAFLFMHYERWTYDESVYYAFVTLTTIGFGDLVAGQDNMKGSGPFFIMYKIFLICWISFGLGYIVMIMTFITRGMRSKKIVQLEHKLAMNLKQTQSKIWNEFNKEVNYLRRVFNELQLSKVKRVYVDEYDYDVPAAKFPRSNSFPDLRKLAIGGCTDHLTPHPRRRANSEVVPVEQLMRVVSETDLQRIDKTATFAAHAIVQPAELLARLVNILGYIPPRDEFEWDQNDEQSKQIDAQNSDLPGKSVDQQSLPNSTTQWTIGGERFPFATPRSRAASEVRLHATNDDYVNPSTEWTWSGPVAPNKMREMMNARDTTLPSKNGSNKPYRKFPSLALPITAPKNFFPKWKKQFMGKRSSDVGFTTKNTEKVEITDDSGQQNNSLGPPPSYLDDSHDSITRRPYYYTHTGANLPTYLEGNNLLEETSLADFLRALTALHTRVGTVPDEYAAKPKRKLGTACLTPPKLPSLFTLFSQNAPPGSTTQSNQNTVTDTQSYQSSRRMSYRTAESTSGCATPTSYIRKESLAPKPRRFSLRPVPTPIGPSTPIDYGSPRLSLRLSPKIDDRGLQEPSTDPFIFVSPKEPLVNMEGLPGLSSPIKQPSDNQRFSIRPAQLGAQSNSTDPVSLSASPQTSKPLSKWKASLLQRQIGQINLRRRTRAFSLSDVRPDKRERSPTPLSPLVIDSNKPIDVSKTNQKTVTIMSPAEEMALRNEFQSSAAAFPSVREDQATQRESQEDVTVPIKSCILQIPGEPPAAVNKSTISSIVSGMYPQGDGNSVPTYEPVYRPVSCEEKTFEQKLINFNDALDRMVQETNLDVTETPFGETRETKSSSSGNYSGLRKEKLSVSIDSYKPPLQMTIEKPTVNPFEQYRAMTKSSRDDDVDLKEVRIEKPPKK